MMHKISAKSHTSSTAHIRQATAGPPLSSSLPPIVDKNTNINCTKPCCFKFRLMAALYRPRSSSTKAALNYNRKNSYKSTYSEEYGIKPFSPSHKIIPRKTFNPPHFLEPLNPLTTKETLTSQISENGLLKHYQFQSNYAHTYLGINPIDLTSEGDDITGDGSKKNVKKKQRLMSVFQQDYQVPCLSEKLRTVKQPRPTDYNYLPLIPQKDPPKLKTSYVTDYCHQKLPKLDKQKTDTRKVKFRATDSWID